MNTIIAQPALGSCMFRCGYQKLMMLTRLPRPEGLSDAMLLKSAEVPDIFFVNFPPISIGIIRNLMDRMNGHMLFKPYIFSPEDFAPSYQALVTDTGLLRPFIREQTLCLIQAEGQNPQAFSWITQIAAFPSTNGKVI